ncbi:iron complex outermembrane recepter protein [Parasphingorhabdus marina DSM 22363]|uniref:Iron complex outermembrane recepter protein n=1 Tax=Parasphingorhabdus marina DSM 22363 TaxID=1123272 RepID=A0A1N6DAK2_9SPHN|nr:TonB-dependent receptor [Parasphingorhabdus marina]SIN67767.1 iron complex outermembrane recepter protein [Parasphingorhabdus marina DSM 22363]
MTKGLLAFKNTLVSGTVLGLLAGAGSPALAQTAEQVTEDDDNVIVVTGRLRGNESVQDVPLAVTVVSPQQLAEQGSLTIEDVETLSPNLVIDPVGAGPGGGAISLRGVSFEDIERSFEPTVGVVIDGVFIGTNSAQLTNAFDFEQVEVLRGPQGTLFGRNTIGGVINVRRSRPTKELGIKAEATFGNFGRQEFNGVVNFGDGDIFGLKLFGYDRTFDGFYNNVTLGVDTGANSNTNVGATALIEPDSNLEILLTAEYSDIGGDTAVASLSDNTDAICLGFAMVIPEQCNRNRREDLLTVFANELGDIQFEEWSFSGQINYDFGDLTLTSITALKDSDERVIQDFDGTSIPFFQTDRAQDYRQFSQELRLSGEFTDGLGGVIGLFYFENEYQLDQTTTLPGGAQVNPMTDHQTKSYAVFADFDVELTDALRLSLGGRYSFDEKEFTRTLAPGVAFSNDDDWSQFTPRISLDYRASDDVLLYASYARGYRSGGFNGRANSPSAVATSFDPETVDSFEIGAKTEFADGAVTLNLAGFYSKYDDKQEDVVQATPPGSANPQETVTLNAASATIFGAEADLRAELFEGFTVVGSLGLLDASYDSFFVDLNVNGVQDAGEDASSRQLRRTPDVTFSVAANYELPVADDGKLGFNVRFSNTSSYQTTIVAAPGNFGQNDPRGLHQAQSDLSAALTYTHSVGENADVYVRVFGRNLTDEVGLSSALPVAGLFTFGTAIPPRQYGVTVGFKY